MVPSGVPSFESPVTGAAPLPAPAHRRPRLLILVGLPGSGKTCLSTALQAHGWVRASQDESKSGRRQECEAVVRAALSAGRDVVVDRVGFDEAQRAHFVRIAREAAFLHGVDCWCLILDTPYHVLQERLLARPEHPTLHTPELALKVLGQMQRQFSPPHRAYPEGFDRVLSLPFERQPTGGVWDADGIDRLLRDIEGSEWRDERVAISFSSGRQETWAGGRGGGGGGGRGWRGGYRGGRGGGGWGGGWREPQGRPYGAGFPADPPRPQPNLLGEQPRGLERRI